MLLLTVELGLVGERLTVVCVYVCCVKWLAAGGLQLGPQVGRVNWSADQPTWNRPCLGPSPPDGWEKEILDTARATAATAATRVVRRVKASLGGLP